MTKIIYIYIKAVASIKANKGKNAQDSECPKCVTTQTDQAKASHVHSSLNQ